MHSPRGNVGLPGEDWKVSSTWHGRDSIKIGNFDRLVPASNLRDKDFPTWVRREGLGTPGLLWRSPSKDQDFVSPIGTALPVTWIRRGDRLDIYDVLDSDTAGGAKLAVNYTAPLAYMRKQGDLKLPVVRAMIKTDRYDAETGLYRFEPVDTNRIPVIFVHGIKSSPSIWKNMVNRLRADEDIRENYQFWSFSYATGTPILYSSMRLREDLKRMQAIYNPDGKHAKMNKMVIIGHSMGGLVSELQIKDSGDAFWPADGPKLAELNLSKKKKKLLEDTVYFKAVPQIKRAIFIATPHQGSDIAISRFGEALSRLISLPAELTGVVVSIAKLEPSFGPISGIEGHIPTAVDNLRPNSPFLQSLRKQPFNKGVPIHSIVATGETPLVGALTDANDGIVSYQSAHLKEAVSEKAVQSGHRAPNHPEAISEVVRILRLHLRP